MKKQRRCEIRWYAFAFYSDHFPIRYTARSRPVFVLFKPKTGAIGSLPSYLS